MRDLPTDKPFLLALNQGLSPHAEPLICDDLRGPDSLFGEGAQIPKPKRASRCLSRKDGNSKEQPLDNSESLVLWEMPCIMPLEEAAARILSGATEAGTDLSVAAPVYLAGRSTSSFNIAWSLAGESFFGDWSSVVCSCQTEGRGQLRRAWHSPRGNLYVSFRLPRDPVFAGDAASLVVGYVVVRALRLLGFPLSLKWPNDIVLDQTDKVGGILLEERDGVLIAGLGLNLSEVPPDSLLRERRALRAGRLLPHHAGDGSAVWMRSARQDDDAPFAPFTFWKFLACALIFEYSRTAARHGLSYVLEDLNYGIRPEVSPAPSCEHTVATLRDTCGEVSCAQPLLAWKDRRVLLYEGENACGRLLGVGPGGGVLLGLDNGAEQEFFSGSLSLAD